MVTLDASKVSTSRERDGAFSFVTRDKALLDQARDLFDRKNEKVIIKIFHYPLYCNSENFIWGKFFENKQVGMSATSKALEALKIQNLFSYKGLAPRVYGIFLVKSRFDTKHLAVLMDDAVDVKDSSHNEVVYEPIRKECRRLYINPPYGDIGTSRNVSDNWWLDWQGARFTSKYLKSLKKRFLEGTKFANIVYQTIPELDIKATRDTQARVKELRLSELDFEGRRVIDLGCSGGAFLNYVMERGAKYAVGIDYEEVITAAREMSNYLGHFNIDYIASNELHLKLPPVKSPFDFIIYTSMVTHTGVPDYLHNLGRYLILEINHTGEIEDTLKKLEPHWHIEEIPRGEEYGGRAKFHCTNKIY